MELRHRLISVWTLAAMDIVFHGPKLILVEFAVGMGGTGLLGLWSLYRGLAPKPHNRLSFRTDQKPARGTM